MKCPIVVDRDAGDADDEVTECDSSSEREETETDVSELNKGIHVLVLNDYAIWAPRQVFAKSCLSLYPMVNRH